MSGEGFYPCCVVFLFFVFFPFNPSTAHESLRRPTDLHNGSSDALKAVSLLSPFCCGSCWISSKTSLLYIIHGPICAALLVRSFSLFHGTNHTQETKNIPGEEHSNNNHIYLLNSFAPYFFWTDVVVQCALPLSGHCVESESRKAATRFPTCIIAFILCNRCIFPFEEPPSSPQAHAVFSVFISSAWFRKISEKMVPCVQPPVDRLQSCSSFSVLSLFSFSLDASGRKFPKTKQYIFDQV